MFKYIWLLSTKIKGHQHLIFSSYCLAAVPARWLFPAAEGMLTQKLITLASTILLLQRMKILPTQGICKEAPLATRLHTNKIEGFWGCLKRWLPRSGPYNLSQNISIYLCTNRINKVDPFLDLVNLVKENNSTDAMNADNDIFPDVEEEEEDAMDCESD